MPMYRCALLQFSALNLVATFTLMIGCGKDEKSNKGYKVRTELLRAGSLSTALVQSAPEMALAADVNTYAWTSGISLEELVLPIRSVILSEFTGDSSTKSPQVIYECDSDCDVNVLGPELTDLLGSKEAELKVEGTFQQIAVGFGEGTANWTGKIKGTFTLGGVKYYTKASGSPTTQAPSEAASYTAMGGGSISLLPEPLVLVHRENEATRLTIKLYFDALNAAFAYDGSKMPNASFIAGGFCTGNDTERKSLQICTQRLVVSASTQEQPPSLERYRINDSSLASLFFDNGETPVGGFLKSYFREGYPYLGYVGGTDPVKNWSGELKAWASGPVFQFSKNADGTFVISTMIGEPAASKENGGFRAKAFKRETHQAKYSTAQGKEYDYSAVKLP